MNKKWFISSTLVISGVVILICTNIVLGKFKNDSISEIDNSYKVIPSMIIDKYIDTEYSVNGTMHTYYFTVDLEDIEQRIQVPSELYLNCSVGDFVDVYNYEDVYVLNLESLYYKNMSDTTIFLYIIAISLGAVLCISGIIIFFSSFKEELHKV